VQLPNNNPSPKPSSKDLQEGNDAMGRGDEVMYEQTVRQSVADEFTRMRLAAAQGAGADGQPLGQAQVSTIRSHVALA